MGPPAKFRLGRSSHGEGRCRQGGAQVAPCEELGGKLEGICHPPPVGHTSKTGEARLDLSRLGPHPRFTQAHAPAHPLPRRPLALHPTLSPCHPVTLPARTPACLPKICPTGGQGRAFQSTASPSQPQAPVQTESHPIAGSTGRQLHQHCTPTSYRHAVIPGR